MKHCNRIDLKNRQLFLKGSERHIHYRFSRDIIRDIRSLKPDNWHGPIYLIKDYAIIGALVFISSLLGWWFYPIAVLFIGAHQRAISTILHDAAHGVLTRNNHLNYIIGTIFSAWPIFQRYYAYRESHVKKHHPLLGKVGSDPDLDFFIEEEVFEPRSTREYVTRIILLPMIGSKTLSYMKYLVKNRYKEIGKLVRRNRRLRTEDPISRKYDNYGFYFFWAIVISVCYQLSVLDIFFLYWLVPYITSFHVLGWFIEMSEHCSTMDEKENLYMTRNRKSRGLEKLLTGINNDHYHLDHHLNPSTPFWLLPKAHEIRLRDKDYAHHCSLSGGLFTKGPKGEPSIISILLQQNKLRYSAVTNFNGTK